MKRFLFVIGLLFFTLNVHASTDCSAGCDVDGGTLVDVNFVFTGWSNPSTPAQVKIVNQSGGFLAGVSIASVSSFGSPKVFDFFPNSDGNYLLWFLAQGTDNNYTVDIDFISNGSPSNFFDVNCVGNVCGPEPQVYKLNVSNTPSNQLDVNKSVPFSVKGGEWVNVSVKYLTGHNCGTFSTPCDASIAIRRIGDNNVVALKHAASWSDWSSTSGKLDWKADYDGDYVLEIWYQGSVGRYDMNLSVTDLNATTYIFSDEYQYVGGNYFWGNTNRYYFSIDDSPSLDIADTKTFVPPVKGGTIVNAYVRFFDGHNCNTFSTPCDVYASVRRTSDNATVAFKYGGAWSDWSSSPVLLDWYADIDDSYYVEVWYEGSWVQYDLNIVYVDSSDVNHNYFDTRYVGSGLTTSNTTQYYFNVVDSPPVLLNDGDEFFPPVAGGKLMNASIRMYDGHNCNTFSTPCDAYIAVRRTSDNAKVAFKYAGSWSDWLGSPAVLDWYADADDNYYVEVWYEGTWVQYDLNVSYTGSFGGQALFSDNYQYVGNGLATGSTTQYFFNVIQSPAKYLDDGLQLPLAAIANQPFIAKIRMYDGHNCNTFSTPCNASIAIKDLNGTTVTSISTNEYYNFNNTTIQFNPQTGHEYMIEVWYEGAWVQFDLNVDYTDNVGKLRHYEDKFQYLGNGLETGNYAQYFLNGGASCGNGINCPVAPTCVPVVLHGDPTDKIDVVFIGSGFSNNFDFENVVDDMIGADGNTYGILHYSPFKEYYDKFNFWRIDWNGTFSGGMKKNLLNLWEFDGAFKEESLDLVKLNCNGINEQPTPLRIVLLVEPRVRSFADANPYANTVNGAAYVTVGQEYLDNCEDSDPLCENPWPIFVQNTVSILDENVDVGANRTIVQRATVHEFGHSFGALADEYEVGFINPFGSGQMPNCDDEPTCDKWSSVTNTCLPLCGYQNFYKPYPLSIMNWPTAPVEIDINFMPVSQLELERDINSYFNTEESLQLLSFDSFVINIIYSDENLSLKSLNVLNQPTNVSTNEPESGYSLVVYDSSDQNIFSMNFSFPIYSLLIPSGSWFDENGTQIYVPTDDQVVVQSDINMSLSFPALPDSTKVKIFDVNGSLKLEANLPSLTPTFEYTIGYGGGSISSLNYLLQYSLLDQSVERLYSSNYELSLGPIFSQK